VRVLVHVGGAQADGCQRFGGTLALLARLVSASASSGSATMRATVWRGSSEPYGSWNTIWKSRRAVRSSFFGSVCRSRPSSETLPEVGVSSAITRRAMVDLPEPDSPTMPTLWPAST
jgi:hypothetical protein